MTTDALLVDASEALQNDMSDTLIRLTAFLTGSGQWPAWPEWDWASSTDADKYAILRVGEQLANLFSRVSPVGRIPC